MVTIHTYHEKDAVCLAKPSVPEKLGDLSVNVDLHTLKASDAPSEWAMLMSQIRKGIEEGLCGVMIHHQRMNDNAFAFLELFFQMILKYRFEICSMSMLLNSTGSDDRAFTLKGG
ncbi:hypothetical protein MTBBW1_1260011 [Desulfamplus magnetovallimortis]|uniref:Polysaccharide deacetylase n=1 Tax=Desulfamplus magnetovallimortis TaxID=1246637 RepID=A0A1W1H6K3_9BACT|nr:hypothetical protein MTBBW1_1260011 [Desulfamplus magnetovallimortis]